MSEKLNYGHLPSGGGGSISVFLRSLVDSMVGSSSRPRGKLFAIAAFLKSEQGRITLTWKLQRIFCLCCTLLVGSDVRNIFCSLACVSTLKCPTFWKSVPGDSGFQMLKVCDACVYVSLCIWVCMCVCSSGISSLPITFSLQSPWQWNKGLCAPIWPGLTDGALKIMQCFQLALQLCKAFETGSQVNRIMAIWWTELLEVYDPCLC